MKLKHFLLFSATLLIFAFYASVEAASVVSSVCVGPTATGNGSGSDWNNQAAWSSVSFVRGNEYYFADGTYTASRTLNTASSGSTFIKLCKATGSTVGSCSTAHGSANGWSSTYGDGQALFTTSKAIDFESPYWILDGVVGSTNITSSFGFYFVPPTGTASTRPVQIGANSNTAPYTQVRHIAVTCQGQSYDTDQFSIAGLSDNVTVSNVYLENHTVGIWANGNNWTIQNSWFGFNSYFSANHGVQLEMIDNYIIRNNVFTYCDPQCMEPGGNSTTNATNASIYNNVFANVGPNGVAKGVSSGAYINCLFYGNTVVNSAGPLLYQNNEGLGYGYGNVVVNNLIYNSSSDVVHQSTGGAISHSYNALFNSGTLSETGGQTGSGNPFVNSAGGDYNLSSATNAGTTLSSPYSVDIEGNIRGADGVWDRGAYEFGGNNSLIRPNPPILH